MLTSDKHRAIERSLRQYLTRHPLAADTAAGIKDWWLVRYKAQASLKDIQEVLQHLVDEGVMEQAGGKDSTIYRLKTPPSGKL